MPIVTHVRKEMSSDGTHEHIAAVKTTDGMTYSRAEVVGGLDRGEDWQTKAPSGHSAKIDKVNYCPTNGCVLSPYVHTYRDQYADDNLDNLPTF